MSIETGMGARTRWICTYPFPSPYQFKNRVLPILIPISIPCIQSMLQIGTGSQYPQERVHLVYYYLLPNLLIAVECSELNLALEKNTLHLFVSGSQFMYYASRWQFHGSLVLSCKLLSVLGVDIVLSYCMKISLLVFSQLCCAAMLSFVLSWTASATSTTLSFPFYCPFHILWIRSY